MSWYHWGAMACGLVVVVSYNACGVRSFQLADSAELSSSGASFLNHKTCPVEIYQADDKLYRRNRQIITNALTDLFGANLVAGVATQISALPQDSKSEFQYETLVDSVSESHTIAYFDLATAVAEKLKASPALLNPYFAKSCTITTDLISNGCLQSLLQNLGGQLFSREVTSNEITTLERVYTSTSGTYSEKLETVLSVLLQDPRFLFQDLSNANRNEVLASELARLVWQSIPDAQLMAMAKAGILAHPDMLSQQVSQMLQDPKGIRTIENFLSQWLNFNNIPDFDFSSTFLSGVSTSGVSAAMIDEYRSFLHHIVVEQRGSFQDLMLSRAGKVTNTNLAKIYGVPASSNWQELPPERAGILSRAATLVSGRNQTNPIMRGVHIAKEILCFNIPNPSADAIDMRPEGIDHLNMSTRQYNDARTSGASCIGCHTMINPPGHAIGSFDGLGRFVQTDRIFNPDGTLAKTFPIDTSTTLLIDGHSVAIKDSMELSAAIAYSRQGPKCMTLQMYRFWAGRPESKVSCGIEATAQSLKDGQPILSVLEKVLTVELERLM